MDWTDTGNSRPNYCDDSFENWSFIKVVNFLLIWVTVTVQKAYVSREISVSKVLSPRDIHLWRPSLSRVGGRLFD